MSVDEQWSGAAARAGVAYTLVVFAIAFALGALRVTLVVPRVGELVAVLLETPLVLAVSWWASRACVRRYAVSAHAPARLLMGAIAFTLLMLFELSLSVLVLGESLAHYLARLASTAGLVGLAAQGAFALIPWLQRHAR